jgi:uncharacterized sulfatase
MNHGKVKPGTRSIAHYLGEIGYRVALAGKTHIAPQKCFPFQYIEQRIDLIDEFVSRPGPFCLIVASARPHLPHEAKPTYDPGQVVIPPKWIDTPQTREQQVGYYTDVSRFDDEIGEVLKVLHERGLEDNTLVACTSDHGNQFFAKWTCYDDGLRIPLAVRWPGHIQPGSVSRAMVGHIDWVATLLDAAGGPIPPGLDGRSFLGILTGRQTRHHDILFGAQTNQGTISGKPYPIRSVRNERYKYIRNLMSEALYQNVNTHSNFATERTNGVWGSWLAVARTDPQAAHWVQWHRHRPAEELYDLENDPRELTNLAGDASLAAVQSDLAAKLDAWMTQQGDQGIAAEMQVAPHRRGTVDSI